MEPIKSQDLDLFKLFQEKLNLLSQMLSLTEKQYLTFTSEEELDQLEKLIQLKQQIIEKVDKINGNLAQMEKSVSGGYNTKEVKETKHQIEAVALKIHQLETGNIERLSTTFEEVKKELDKLRTGKKVTENYYVKPVQEGGYFINRRR